MAVMSSDSGSSSQTQPTSTPRAQLDRDRELTQKLQEVFEREADVPVSTTG